MQIGKVAYAGMVFIAVALVLVGGCRSSSTDRIRVLEAEKADAERRADELAREKATLRAKNMEIAQRAESEKARADAYEEQTNLLKGTMDREPAVVRVDTEKLAGRLRGADVQVKDLPDGAAIILAADVSFSPGRADLSKKAQSSLRQVAVALKQTEGIRAVRVEGHTDSDPIRKSGWKSNEALSLARAEMVRKYLVDHGIERSLLQVKGFGAAVPVDRNKTDEGKARNRRVEIVVLEQ
ncbi:MAG: OmpA/MotB family protein [Planctomycetota bacterium]|jgi:flagellar motor protein MotB